MSLAAVNFLALQFTPMAAVVWWTKGEAVEPNLRICRSARTVGGLRYEW